MSILKNWNKVPFDLELIVDFDSSIINKSNREKLDNVTEKVRARVFVYYPAIKLPSSIAFSGTYGGRQRGPALLNCETDVKTFRTIFGDNIKRGFSLLFPPALLPIPCDAYIKWYQTGDLSVPELLKDIVKGVYLSRSPTSSFGELNLHVPIRAR